MITKNPHILGGMKTINNTRISVEGIQTVHKEGLTVEEIVHNLHYAGYPDITKTDIYEAIGAEL